MDESQKRIGFIDTSKGILIILVVIGHVTNFNTIPTAILKTWLYSFHIPAFFIISGILISPNKLLNLSFICFFKKKFFRLLVPYIFFEITGGILQMVLFGWDVVNMKGIIYGMLTMHCNVGADWFLPTLFLAEIFVYWSVKIQKPLFHFSCGVICFFFAIYVPEIIYPISILRRVCMAYIFILLGIYLKHFFLHNNKIIWGLCGIGTLIVIYLNGIVDLSMRQFNNPVLYLIGGIIGTYFILCLSQKITKKSLEKIGGNSLIIMGTHQNVMVIINGITGDSVYTITIQIIVLVLLIIYESLTIILYNKYVPFFVGKKSMR